MGLAPASLEAFNVASEDQPAFSVHTNGRQIFLSEVILHRHSGNPQHFGRDVYGDVTIYIG